MKHLSKIIILDNKKKFFEGTFDQLSNNTKNFIDNKIKSNPL